MDELEYIEMKKFTREEAILELVKYTTSSSFALILEKCTNKELIEYLIEWGVAKNPIIINHGNNRNEK